MNMAWKPAPLSSTIVMTIMITENMMVSVTTTGEDHHDGHMAVRR